MIVCVKVCIETL